MEVIINVIAEFLLGKAVKVIERWSLRNREAELLNPEEEALPPRQRCPFGPVLPSRDYLEAMMGDFLEQQQELQRQNGPPKRVLWITTLRLIALSADVLAITWQNVSTLEHNHAPVPPPPSSLDNIDDDELPELEMDMNE